MSCCGPLTNGRSTATTGCSQLEEAVAKNARLQAANGELLTIAQDCYVRAAWHDADLGDEIHVSQGASPQSDETRRIEPLLQIFQTVADRVALVSRRGDVEQLTLRHN